MQPSLTAQTLRSAAPQERPYELRSRRVPGLLLRVQPTGHRAYYVQVGRARRVLLGDERILSLSDAEERARKARLDPDAFLAGRVKGMTLGDFVEHRWKPWVLTSRLSGKATAQRMKAQWSHLYATPMEGVTVAQVDSYRTEKLKEGKKASSINRSVGTLHAALGQAVTWGLLEAHPLARLKPLRESGGRLVYLNPAQVRAVVRAACNPPPKAPPYLKPLVLLALNTGMRQGELMAMRWGDIDWAVPCVNVLASKTGTRRSIPLNKQASDALIDWFHVRNKAQDLVFPGTLKGGKRREGGVPLRSLFARAGVPWCTLHVLRHTFATRLVQNGVDLSTVMALTGHTNLRTLTRYTHAAPGRLAGAVEGLLAS